MEALLTETSLYTLSEDFHHRSCSCSACRANLADNQNGSNSQDNQSQSSYLTIDSLWSDWFSSHTQDAVNYQGETLEYFIYKDNGYVDFEGYEWGYSLGHTSGDINFIRDAFERIDGYIDLDFKEAFNWNNSTFDIYCLDSYSEWGNSTVGLVEDRGWGSGSYWDVLWKDTDGTGSLSDFDASTIIHEIGHALGLSHPYEDPYNGNWHTGDTVMSYNASPSGWNAWFSSMDIATLVQIWGVEDDNGRGHNGTDSRDVIRGSNSHDIIAGYGGNDQLIAIRGSDTLFGFEGDDEIRAGNGRDYIWGGSGSDEMYGGFGLNTWEDTADGEIDQLFFKSDQHAYNWIYAKDGNSPNGEKADKIMELDSFDEIFVQGVETEELDFQNVVHYSNLGETLEGIGIYASGALEAVYVGDDLSLGQIESMTQGII